MFTNQIIVEIKDDMAIVMRVIMFDGSPVKRLLLSSDGEFIEERLINMESDAYLYVHSAHIDDTEQSVQRTAATPRKTGTKPKAVKAVKSRRR